MRSAHRRRCLVFGGGFLYAGRRRCSFLTRLGWISTFALVTAASSGAAEQTIALKAARLFDGKGKALITNGVVMIQGDRIVEAGKG